MWFVFDDHYSGDRDKCPMPLWAQLINRSVKLNMTRIFAVPIRGANFLSNSMVTCNMNALRAVRSCSKDIRRAGKIRKTGPATCSTSNTRICPGREQMLSTLFTENALLKNVTCQPLVQADGVQPALLRPKKVMKCVHDEKYMRKFT